MSRILTIAVVLFLATIHVADVFAGDGSPCKKLAGENPDPFVVVGRVVDVDGRPVKGSSVSIDPRGSTEMKNPYESEMTDENGCFKFVGFGKAKAQKAEWFLYTTGRFGLPGISLVGPPDVRHLQKLDSRYNGIPFIPGKRKVVDMGDVPIVFRYGSVRLGFDGCSEDKCSSVIQWGTSEVALVHCESNKTVERGTLSREKLKQYIYDKNADLIFLLPEGNWKIEIYSIGAKEPLAVTQCVEIVPNDVISLPVALAPSARRQ